MTHLYKGFSTREYASRHKSYSQGFAIYDVACIQDDLMNEIFTIKGERIYMPNFGTRIPLMTFEPNDTESAMIIEEDVTEVISHDPRVTLINISVTQAKDKHALVCIAKVRYNEFNVVQDLYIEVNSR